MYMVFFLFIYIEDTTKHYVKECVLGCDVYFGGCCPWGVEDRV